MKTIHYFCTAGDTELRGMQAFLLKINHSVSWVRQFPAVEKKAPKAIRSDQVFLEGTLRRNQVGYTGKRLRSQMLNDIRNYRDTFQQGKSDGILFIDDADCRFTIDTYNNWVEQTSADIREAVGWDIPVFVLLQSPEVESWLLMDWENSFAKEYRHPAGLEHLLKQYLIHKITRTSWDNIEWFGGPCIDDACTQKLSELIIQTINSISYVEEASFPFQTRFSAFWRSDSISYSKKENGGRMLTQINPENIAESCPFYFAPTYRELKTLS